MAITIYALADPDKPQMIRYIGKTKKTLSDRLSHHLWYMRRKNTPKNAWLKKLRREGKRPAMWPIEICTPDNWEERERFWIRLFRNLPGLLNLTEGGDSGPDMTGYRFTPEQRAKVSKALKGRKCTPEAIANSRRALIASGWRPNAEQRRKLGLAHKGKKHTEQHKANISKGLMGHACSPETRAKIGNVHRGKKLSSWHLHRLMSNREQAIESMMRKCAKPVRCVDTGEVFKSVGRAAISVGGDQPGLSQALKYNRKYKNRTFEFIKKEI